MRHQEIAKKSVPCPNFDFITVYHQEKAKKKARQQPYSIVDHKGKAKNAVLAAVHVPEPVIDSNVHVLNVRILNYIYEVKG